VGEPLDFTEASRRVAALQVVEFSLDDVVPRCAPHPTDFLDLVGLPRFVSLVDLGLPSTLEGDRVTTDWICRAGHGERHLVPFPVSMFHEPDEWYRAWPAIHTAEQARFLCDIHRAQGWDAMTDALRTLN
jgi:hypothetical protein